MTKHGKAYADATEKYDRDQPVAARDALERVRSLAPAKFDLVLYQEFHQGYFNWFDLFYRGTPAPPS